MEYLAMEYNFLASLGGVGVIIIGLSRWFGGIWSKRIIQLEKYKLDEELERTKAILQSNIEKTKAECNYSAYFTKSIRSLSKFR